MWVVLIYYNDYGYINVSRLYGYAKIDENQGNIAPLWTTDRNTNQNS